MGKYMKMAIMVKFMSRHNYVKTSWFSENISYLISVLKTNTRKVVQEQRQTRGGLKNANNNQDQEEDQVNETSDPSSHETLILNFNFNCRISNLYSLILKLLILIFSDAQDTYLNNLSVSIHLKVWLILV